VQRERSLQRPIESVSFEVTKDSASLICGGRKAGQQRGRQQQSPRELRQGVTFSVNVGLFSTLK